MSRYDRPITKTERRVWSLFLKHYGLQERKPKRETKRKPL